MLRFFRLLALVPVLTGISVLANPGVRNPDLSVLGQMRIFSSDDREDPDRGRLQFHFHEAELVADGYLNPYARGWFVFAVAHEEIEIEEAFLSLVRGLPKGLALKAGKYRVGFGRLNAVHPHAYPFLDRFRVMEEYLPGEEAFNEVGVQLSYLRSVGGNSALTISADVLEGRTFHPDDPDAARLAVLGRGALFFPIGEPSAFEVGVSAASGINDVAARTRTVLLGADAKLKWWFNARSNAVVHSEVFAHNSENPVPDGSGLVAVERRQRWGGFLFTDFTLHKRYNFGAKYERFQCRETDANNRIVWEQSAGLFCGFALMEETTLFRLNWDCALPHEKRAVNTFTLQAVFSLGPHKPHQF